MPQPQSPNHARLSVVIASTHPIIDNEECLNALKQQGMNENLEVIVVDASHQDVSEELMAKYHDVQFIRLAEGANLPELWGEGISQSTGAVIAITESTCRPDPSWINSILKAHESANPVIGGAVEISKAARLVDWAAYFCEYGQFMYPLKEGTANELPGNNVSFKRWVLEIGKEFLQNGFWKTYWCQRLQKKGIQLVLMPSILVYYNKTYRLVPFLIRRFHHGRCFGGMRATATSSLRRFCYAIGSPLLPFLFLARCMHAIIPKKRYLKEFILSFPISILAIFMWSFGEFCGYIAGKRQSCSYIY